MSELVERVESDSLASGLAEPSEASAGIEATEATEAAEAFTKYKLKYFPVMALGEPIRWLLAYGNLPFEDIRLSPDEWAEQKEDAPFGAIPILEVNDKQMHQSQAICRYLGNVVGLSGSNEWENFEIDVVADSISDLRASIAAYNKLSNSSLDRPALKRRLMQETIPYYLGRFESMAKDTGYLANGKLSWADIYFVALLEYKNGVLQEDIIDPLTYPNLNKLREEIRTMPEITAWIEKRPHSDY